MQTTSLTHPHLRWLYEDAEAVRAEAERFRRTYTDTQLTWKPGPGVWSIADCFEHLRKMNKAYIRTLGGVIERAEPGEAAFKPSLFARAFIYLVSPRSSLKMKTLKDVRPSQDTVSAEPAALDRFIEQQATLLDLIRRADGKDLNGNKFSSPLARVVRLSLGEGLTVVVVHEQRHLGQAQRLTEHADFPA